ncbi:MAG: Mu transposase C-terminal domain-containing protein [Deltaproteobacteria bacterium]|nr:Mu transposase C-terminal domain-containing protein [Deltaproteobacteria bacterium]
MQQALARADLVGHYLRYAVEKKNGGGVLGAKRDFLVAYNLGITGLFPRIFHLLGEVTFGTIERWTVKTKRAEDPVTALASKHGEHLKGKHLLGGPRREIKDFVTSEQGRILLGAALSSNQPHLTEAIRTAKDIFAFRGIPDDQSEDTYRRFLEEFRARFNDHWVFYRKGEKALHDECLPYLERDTDFLEVGDCWVADGHRLNFEIINPYTGKPTRMTLITFEDWKSNYPVGWEIMPEENTQAIAAAFRRGCLFLGQAPRAVYIDNGKAFGAKYFTSNLAESGMGGLFQRAGLKSIVAWKYHAQSKVVERFFKTLGEFERLMPSYTGTSIDQKPAWRRGGEKLHKRMHEKITQGRVPTLEEAHQLLAAWLDKYAAREQKRSHLAGRSPGQVLDEYFENRRESGIQDLDPGALRHLMMQPLVRSIDRNGVTVPGNTWPNGWLRHYYSEELYGHKHQVLVRYDLHDPRSVLIYDLDGEFICEAPLKFMTHPIANVTGTAEDQAEVKRQIQQKQGLLKQTTASARAFTAAVVVPETQERLRLQGFDPAAAGGAPALPPPPPPVDLEEVRRQVEAAEVLSGGEPEEELVIPGALDEAELACRGLSNLPDPEHYDRLLVLEAGGLVLPTREKMFQRYFEMTPDFLGGQDYYAQRRAQLMACGAGAH